MTSRSRRTTRLAFALDAVSSQVAISPNDLMQVLVNLVANARDAMPEGGRLAVATRNVTVGCQGRRERFPLGALAIEVSDTGTAPDAEGGRFEPVLSARSPEPGTGLATVQQIIERCGGCVEVETTPGAGTTIRVLVPPAPHTSLLHGVWAA